MIARAGGPPPPEGGPLTPGTYALTSANIFGTNEADGATWSTVGLETFVVTAGSMENVVTTKKVSTGEPVVRRSTYTYAASGSNLVLTRICPVGGPTAPLELTFTASSGALTIIAVANQKTQQLVYTKQ